MKELNACEVRRLNQLNSTACLHKCDLPRICDWNSRRFDLGSTFDSNVAFHTCRTFSFGDWEYWQRIEYREKLWIWLKMRLQHVQELFKSNAFLFLAHEAKRFQPLFLLSPFSVVTLSVFHRPTKGMFKEVRKSRFNSVLQIKLTLKPCSSLYFVFYIYCATQETFMIRITKKYKNVESNGEEA